MPACIDKDYITENTFNQMKEFMKKQLFTLSLLLCSLQVFSIVAPKPEIYVSEDRMIRIADREVTLRSGTPIVVEAIQTNSSKHMSVGQTVNVRVKFNVVKNKETLIAAGAIGTAQISKISKAGIFGKPGKMELQIQSVQAVDGQQVLLSGIPLVLEGQNKRALAWGLSIGIGLLTLGIGLVAGIFIEGKDAEFSAGTNIHSSVASDMQIEVQ